MDLEDLVVAAFGAGIVALIAWDRLSPDRKAAREAGAAPDNARGGERQPDTAGGNGGPAGPGGSGAPGPGGADGCGDGGGGGGD